MLILLSSVLPARASSPSPDPVTWTNVGPEGANISVVALAPSNPSIVYIALGNLVLRSDDRGNHWSGPETGFPEYAINSLTVDPFDPMTAYAGVWYPINLYKTTDGGSTWQPSRQGIPESYGNLSLVMDPVNRGVLYAHTGGVIYKSTDAGGSWNAMQDGLPDGEIRKVVVAPSDPSILYLVLNNESVYKSTDAAAHWFLVNQSLPPYLYMVGMAVDPNLADTVYLGIASGKMYKSTDGGVTWVEGSQGLPGYNISNILVDPSSPEVVYACTIGDGLYISRDAGVTWNKAPRMGNFEPSSLAMTASNPHMLYASFSGQGVYRSPDGGSNWIPLNNELHGVYVRRLFTNPKLPGTVYAGTSIGFLNSTNRGSSWNYEMPWIYIPDIVTFAVAAQDPKIMYAGSDGGGLYETSDRGKHWNYIGAGVYPLVEVYALAVDPVTSSTVYAGGQDVGLYKSTDGGQTWNMTGIHHTTITDLAIDPSNTQILYGAVYDGVVKSTDGGVTWTVMTNGISDACAWKLALDPVHPSTLYALMCDIGLLKTTDGGESWQAIDQDLRQADTYFYYYVSAIALDPQNPSIIYAGLWGIGVFRSVDGGATWAKFGTGLPDVPEIQSLAVSPGGKSCVYVGLSGLNSMGVYMACDTK